MNGDDAYWGVCPECKRSDGFLNVGREHWLRCDVHRVKWCIGANLFSGWRRESEEEWARNAALLADYEDIDARPERCECPAQDSDYCCLICGPVPLGDLFVEPYGGPCPRCRGERQFVYYCRKCFTWGRES